jgi:hypothetical protein
MSEIEVKMLGWKSRRREYIDFHKCPQCGKLREDLSGSDGKADCIRCKGEFDFKAWINIKAKKQVTVCAGCGEKVALTPSSILSGLFYRCHDCSNLIAVPFQNRMISPVEIMSFDWAPSLHKRSVLLDTSLFRVAECLNQEEKLIMRLLFVYAEQEDSHFIWREGFKSKCIVCMDSSQYIGFLRWSNDKGEPVLRQIFIIKERQRQGIGTMLFQYWLNTYALPICNRFGIESPNSRTKGLLKKLGFVGKNGEYIGCYIVNVLF